MPVSDGRRRVSRHRPDLFSSFIQPAATGRPVQHLCFLLDPPSESSHASWASSTQGLQVTRSGTWTSRAAFPDLLRARPLDKAERFTRPAQRRASSLEAERTCTYLVCLTQDGSLSPTRRKPGRSPLQGSALSGFPSSPRVSSTFQTGRSTWALPHQAKAYPP